MAPTSIMALAISHFIAVSTNMASLLLRRTVSRLVTRQHHALKRPTMVAFFSAEAEEKPVIPGVGKYKTSTGLVRDAVAGDEIFSCVIVAVV